MYAFMEKDSEGGFEITIHNVLDDAQDQFDETRVKKGEIKTIVQMNKTGKPFGIGPSGNVFGGETIDKN